MSDYLEEQHRRFVEMKEAREREAAARAERQKREYAASEAGQIAAGKKIAADMIEFDTGRPGAIDPIDDIVARLEGSED